MLLNAIVGFIISGPMRTLTFEVSGPPSPCARAGAPQQRGSHTSAKQLFLNREILVRLVGSGRNSNSPAARPADAVRWRDAASLRLLDDFNRRATDGVSGARAGRTAAKPGAAAAQEQPRHDALVRAGQAVGVARSRASATSSSSGAPPRARSPRPPAGRRAARRRLAARRHPQGSARSVQEKESP